ncbi:hypothetical protein PanWU01x14_186030 [Parasponia andersonii]|uniref:Uncharacterized protein n=1 Tax=Parasponia andersonii TaxID=3476 RepID=A0A2P5C481_PARAD|nr:hypothetical protein PanWU01x14_186030 [Parasponia andersonii]
MDLLCNAYSNDSDEDDGPKPEPETITLPSSKRPKLGNPITHSKPDHPPLTLPTRLPLPRMDPQVPGRYVSKRERALFASPQTTPDPDALPNSTVFGSILDSNIRGDILSLLRNKGKSIGQQGKMSQRVSIALSGHTKAVNAIHWSPTHGYVALFPSYLLVLLGRRKSGKERSERTIGWILTTVVVW